MIATLYPCPGCRRHVRYAETSCPFCTTGLAPRTPPRIPDVSRLSRAAQVAVGAAMLVSCASDPNPGPAGPPAPTEDAGAQPPTDVTAMYGAPAPPPESTGDPQSGPPDSPPSNPEGPKPLYGMPAPPR